MPNVGKSSLLNALRNVSMHKKKAARTGDQPGVTRKINQEVKIIEGLEKSDSVYLVDTPGVFIPYVSNSESMLKLALCGSVKDDIIDPVTLADYLLYSMNKHDPALYAEYSSPTNDIAELLEAVGHKTGRLAGGGLPNESAAALWVIQRWRNGKLGKFVLDDVTPGTMNFAVDASDSSFNQARLADKEMRRQRAKQQFTSR